MKHDESKDVRLLSRIAKINLAQKTITIPENAIIGNKRWGRLDFLCNHCGYRIIRPSGIIMSNAPSAEKERNKRDKREERERINRKRRQDKFVRS